MIFYHFIFQHHPTIFNFINTFKILSMCAKNLSSKRKFFFCGFPHRKNRLEILKIKLNYITIISGKNKNWFPASTVNVNPAIVCIFKASEVELFPSLSLLPAIIKTPFPAQRGVFKCVSRIGATCIY